MNDQSKSPYRLVGLSLIVALVAVVSLILVVWWCWVHKKPQPHLVVQNEDTAAWMVINNTFSRKTTAAGATEERGYRIALLFQLGDYRSEDGSEVEGSKVFSKIEVHKQDGGVDPYDRGADPKAFKWWVNILSHPQAEEPLDPAEAFLLFPNPNYCSDASRCALPEWCCPAAATGTATGASTAAITVPCGSGSNRSLKPNCLRGRRLHRSLEPVSIITYWQGNAGYSLQAKQVPIHNEYSVTFGDAFEVRVYEADTSSGSWKWKVPKIYAPGQVARVVVLGVDPLEVTHGNHQAPPWP